jgi:protein subunit release factor A
MTTLNSKDLHVTSIFVGRISSYEVTVCHLPTGVKASVSDQGTTAKNREKAIQTVEERLKFRGLI